MKTLVVYNKNIASSRCVVGLAVCAVVDGVIYVFEAG
jgi:hypothetical protein